MENFLKHLKKAIGLTRSGSSLVGKKILKIRTWRLTNFVIIFLILFVLTSSSLNNIGGTLALSLNTQEPVIDATTISSIQKPMNDFIESRGFSWFHSGADLACEINTPVKAVMTGKVIETREDFLGYGRHIIIDHGNGYTSVYGHLNQILITIGQTITLNTVIGKCGSTGFSTGPHLHLELRANNVPVDPSEIVPEVN